MTVFNGALFQCRIMSHLYLWQLETEWETLGCLGLAAVRHHKIICPDALLKMYAFCYFSKKYNLDDHSLSVASQPHINSCHPHLDISSIWTCKDMTTLLLRCNCYSGAVGHVPVHGEVTGGSPHCANQKSLHKNNGLHYTELPDTPRWGSLGHIVLCGCRHSFKCNKENWWVHFTQ